MDPTLRSRIVLWCDGGANQKALAHKVASRFHLAGVVVEKRRSRRRLLSKKMAARVVERAFFGEADACWRRVLDRYDAAYPRFPSVETCVVENINCDETVALTTRVGADLVMVSGTRMVRERLLELPLSVGIVNLHTGLSPYVKGGPNCTNWCLSEGAFHLIGNTVMWIDAGIDSGKIIASEVVELDGSETLDEIHWRVMEDAHGLYLDAAGAVLRDPENCPSVSQDELGCGITYYNRMWGWRQRKRLLSNLESGRFRDAVTSGEVAEARKNLRTVRLPEPVPAR